jgi:hypothetical protein
MYTDRPTSALGSRILALRALILVVKMDSKYDQEG